MENNMPKEIELLIKKIVGDFNQLFKISTINPVVRIVNSRAEIDKIKERKTEPWVVGTVKDEIIYLLAKDKFETDSNHPKSDFNKVLKHEIAHLYITVVANTNKPFWLNEGMACYLAKQFKTKPSSKDIIRLMDYYDKSDVLIYQIGYFWVSYLVNKFGIEKLIEFLYEWGKVEHNKNNFEALFEDRFGFNLNKDQLLKQL